jgi:hypothetical protein
LRPIDVHHACLGGDALSDLIRVVGGRQAGADVEEPADIRLDGFTRSRNLNSGPAEPISLVAGRRGERC